MPPGPLPSERRVALRHLCDPRSTALVRWSGPHLKAQVRDASAAGLGLLLARPLEAESFVVVELRPPGSRGPVVLEARVAHATAQPDGRWLVGCALLGSLPEEVLAALVRGVPGGAALGAGRRTRR